MICTQCKGEKYLPYTRRRTICPHCNGTGIEPNTKGADAQGDKKAAPACTPQVTWPKFPVRSS